MGVFRKKWRLTMANKYVRVFAALLFAATIVCCPRVRKIISGVKEMVTDSTGAVISGSPSNWTIQAWIAFRGDHRRTCTYQIQRVPPATG